MITFACDKCDRKLEVDDALAGTKVQCPFCGDINIAPHLARAAMPARTPGGTGPAASAPVSDRATAMGLPPDSGPETHVMTIHPAMIRAHPMLGGLLVLFTASGVIAAIILLFSAPPMSLIGVGAALLGLAILGVWRVATWGTSLTITNKRTQVRRGLLSKATREVLHDRVQDIQITQSFWDRIFRVGKIGIASSGESGVEIEVADVPNPGRVREVIDAYRNV
jgi:membrane protein YdbS with pleckstrin-like domain